MVQYNPQPHCTHIYQLRCVALLYEKTLGGRPHKQTATLLLTRTTYVNADPHHNDCSSRKQVVTLQQSPLLQPLFVNAAAAAANAPYGTDIIEYSRLSAPTYYYCSNRFRVVHIANATLPHMFIELTLYSTPLYKQSKSCCLYC
jgi:hypothetical protein